MFLRLATTFTPQGDGNQTKRNGKANMVELATTFTPQGEVNSDDLGSSG